MYSMAQAYTSFVVMPLSPNVISRSRLCAVPSLTNRLRHVARASTAARQQEQTQASPTAATSMSERPKCRVFDLRAGCVPYHQGWELQHALADELKEDSSASDAIVLLEHQPVYTLGTASRLEHVLFDAREVRRNDCGISNTREDRREIGIAGDTMVVRTERGGEVTYHGPGQLVLYPIVNLRRHKMDLHWYLRSLEEAVIHMLHREYGLHASRKQGLTGVWVDDSKVCAIGLKVSKWVTMHGLALNVRTDLKPFSRIVPCGIDSHSVSSIHQLVSRSVCVDRARESLLHSFDHTFGPYDFKRGSHDLL